MIRSVVFCNGNPMHLGRDLGNWLVDTQRDGYEITVVSTTSCATGDSTTGHQEFMLVVLHTLVPTPQMNLISPP